jgi:GT2 family glycosyltransferase
MISQPATLIRRTAWEKVGGLDESLHMAMDYDLWWRLFRSGGPLGYVETDVALNPDNTFTTHSGRVSTEVSIFMAGDAGGS